MVIKVTRWSPDTCGCELEYSWDSETKENTRVHNFAKVVKACDAHKELSPSPINSKRVYDTVLSENQLKNKTLQKVLEFHTEFADFIEPESGKRIDTTTFMEKLPQTSPRSNLKNVVEDYNLGLVLKEDIDYEWNWIESKALPDRPSRTLEINFRVPKTAQVLNPEQATKALKAKTSLQLELDREFNGRVRVKKNTA